MKTTFFARRALIILMIVFFFVPFALRGARMACERMKNDVKDWLPSDFVETSELDWFRNHFLGEQFVVVSWEGCTGSQDDESYKTLVDKFFPETPPSQRGHRGPHADAAGQHDDERPATRDFIDQRLGMYVRQMQPDSISEDKEFFGDRLGLYATGNYHEDWGGLGEKWLKADGDRWFYVTPEGELFRWTGNPAPVTALVRLIGRAITGRKEAPGKYVMSLGSVDGPWYYADPRRMTARVFKSVTTGPGVLSELTRDGGPLENNVPEALHRLRGSLFGPDEKQTCLIITLTEAGKGDMRRVIGRGLLGKPRGQLLDLAEQAGIHPPAKPPMTPPPLSWLLADNKVVAPPVLKLGGPSVDNVAIDEEGQITLVRLIGLSVFIGIGLSWICFRSLVVTIMVFLVGGISAVTSVAIVYWSGSSVDAVLMSMPSLVYVLGISGAVHIVNYYRDAVGESGLRGAPEKAISLGWRPCALAAVTTSLGLLSLYTSNILPIRKFGTFSAIGVLATLVLLFTYLPAALQLWPPKRFRRHRDGQDTGADSALEIYIEKFWTSMGRFVIRRHGWVAMGCVLVLAVCAVGLTKINTSIQLLKLFDSNAKIINDYKWLEANLGKLVPMEIVVRVDPKMVRPLKPSDDGSDPSDERESRYQLSFLERMEIAEYVRQAVEHQFGEQGQQIVGQAMLASTFVPPLPGPGGNLRSSAVRGGFSRRLEAHRDDFLRSDYLRTDKQTGAELWRVSLRLGALNDVDYGRFVGQLRNVVEPVMAAYRYRDEILRSLDAQRGEKGFRGATVYLAGAPYGKSPSAAQRRASAEVVRPADVAANSASSSEQGAVSEVDQTSIFAVTLWRLLRNAGLTTRDWHDPAFELPQDWPELLAAQDCVVWIGDSSLYQEDLIRNQSSLLIDARDHGYVDGSRAETAATRGDGVAAVYTGLVPVVYKAQRTLLTSLIHSTGWAFVMIAMVMMVLLRSPRAGLLSMVPNVFPVVFIFGTMGWSGVLVDIGSMMTASVAMGVAVDDTIHFLTWFRRGLDRGLHRHDAILLSYKRVATAMTQTTVIGGLGLSVFAFSTFTPTQRFGVLMLTLLAAALVGDLIFLPALLASPLGRVFGPSKRSGGQGDSPSQPARSAAESQSVAAPHAPAGDVGERKTAPVRHDKPHRSLRK